VTSRKPPVRRRAFERIDHLLESRICDASVFVGASAVATIPKIKPTRRRRSPV